MLSKIFSIHRFSCPLLAMMNALLCLVTSCSRSDESPFEEPNTLLTIYIESPNNITRADNGTVVGTTDENRLYQTYIWVFDSSQTDDTKAAPIGSITQNLNGATSATLQVSIDRDVISRAPNLDVFVVANVESIPSAYYSMGPDNPPITRARLKEMIFGKLSINTSNFDDFGISRSTHSLETGKGIPMSQYALNQNVINAGVLDKPVNLSLRRAVSKLRFVFARRTGLPNVQVTGFTLEGSLIPNQEYVFPDNTNDRTPHINTSAGYDATALTFTQTLDTESILQHDNPKSLGWNGSENGETYTNRLEEAFGTYTSSLYYGLTYLRETGKKLKGTIHYRLAGDDYTAPFEMAAEGDFTRNHEYIVYAYFEKSGLGLTVSVQDWDRNDINHEFASTVAVAEGGKIRWHDGTYDHIMDEKYVIMHPDINTYPTFTFNIQSPKGATWYAVLRTQEGDPMAFTLCDKDGNTMEQGIVDNNPVTLYVHAREANPAQNNVAELLFVVRCNGQIIPVTVLTDLDGNYVIVQNKNI